MKHLRSVLWALFMIVVNVRADLCNTRRTSIPNLRAALTGFDPLTSDYFTNPNPGIKNTIFDPTEINENGMIQIHSFIGKAQKTLYCNREITSEYFNNFNQYKTEKQKSYSFSKDSDKSVSYDQTYEVGVDFGFFSAKTSKRIHYGYYTGYGRSESRNEKKIAQVFAERGAELAESTAECLTHSVAIASSLKPMFTEAFKYALRELHLAALEPDSRMSKETFVKFVSDYGTHYMKSTRLGSKINLLKFFVESNADVEVTQQRRDCAKSSTQNTLTGVLIADITTTFGNNVKSCLEKAESEKGSRKSTMTSERIISIGVAPTTDLEKWADKVAESPVPISFELDKISNLMKPDWVDDIHVSLRGDNIGVVNGTSIQRFFEEKSLEYCELLLNRDCFKPKTGCGYTSHCPTTSFCVNDGSSPIGYICASEWITVIVGGDSQLQLFGDSAILPQLPPLPTPIGINALGALGSKLYMCEDDACYKIDPIDYPPKWEKFADLPRDRLFGHTVLPVSADLWIFSMNSIFVVPLDNRNVTELTWPSSDPISNSCGVSNGIESYIIPSEGRDVWINQNNEKPDSWERVARLHEGLSYRSCLLVSSEIFVTGGLVPGSSNLYSSVVEVIDLYSRKTRRAGGLKNSRMSHGMGLIGGKPAVFGGRNNKILDTIEVYDQGTDSWQVHSNKLDAPSTSISYAKYVA